MNNRLKAKLMRPRRPAMPRVAYGNLIESMDWCDATRSHELPVSDRLAAFHFNRRLMRRAWGWLLAAAVVTTVIASITH